MSPETSSEAAGQNPEEPQEQPTGDVSPETTPRESSEGQVQEQGSQDELDDEKLEQLLKDKRVQARIYQQAQSLADRRLHQERLRREQEEEQKKLQRMDDEEYGRYLRRQERLQQMAQPLLTQTLEKVFTDAQEQALSTIEDEEARAEVVTRLQANEFKSLPEFLKAVAQAQSAVATKKQIQREAKRLEKELRESIQKELTAEQAEELVPQLGRGVPTRREVHGIEAISEGFAERLKKK